MWMLLARVRRLLLHILPARFRLRFVAVKPAQGMLGLARLAVGALARLLEDAPAAVPANPALLPRPADGAEQERHADAPHAVAAARDPAAARVEVGADGGAGELAEEGEDHEGRVDAVAALGLDGVDGRAVGDLRRLHAKVAEEGLQDRSGDREGARVRAEGDADEGPEHAEHDAEEWHKPVDDDAGVDGTTDHAGDPDQREEADDDRAIVVGRARKKEGKDRPEVRECRRREVRDQTGLHQHRVLRQHDEDTP
nr:hypothetical protein CFP56_21978 [Quercus suber]